MHAPTTHLPACRLPYEPPLGRQERLVRLEAHISTVSDASRERDASLASAIQQGASPADGGIGGVEDGEDAKVELGKLEGDVGPGATDEEVWDNMLDSWTAVMSECICKEGEFAASAAAAAAATAAAAAAAAGHRDCAEQQGSADGYGEGRAGRSLARRAKASGHHCRTATQRFRLMSPCVPFRQGLPSEHGEDPRAPHGDRVGFEEERPGAQAVSLDGIRHAMVCCWPWLLMVCPPPAGTPAPAAFQPSPAQPTGYAAERFPTAAAGAWPRLSSTAQ